MTDELLQLLALLNKAEYIEGDIESITDMMSRYSKPPFTRAYPICMRLSRAEYAKLSQLMRKLNKIVETESQVNEAWIAEQKQRMDERQAVNVP